MLKLDEIIDMWQEDKVVDETSAHTALLNIPILHGKYLEILSKHRIRALKVKFDYSRMKQIRREYFLGNLDKETLDEYGWEPFQLALGNKANIDIYLEADDNLIKLLEKKAYHEECVQVCETILKELNSRTFQLREYLQHSRFLAGN
ncbi:MAG: recombination mediator protein UvsY [Nitrososphaerales archaeon]